MGAYLVFGLFEEWGLLYVVFGIFRALISIFDENLKLIALHGP